MKTIDDEIAEHKLRLSTMSTEAIRCELPTWKERAPGRVACEVILEERKRSDDAAYHPAKDWHEKGGGKFLISVGAGMVVVFVVILIKVFTGE